MPMSSEIVSDLLKSIVNETRAVQTLTLAQGSLSATFRRLHQKSANRKPRSNSVICTPPVPVVQSSGVNAGSAERWSEIKAMTEAI